MPRKLEETYPRIGELLVRKGFVKPHHIDEALAVQRQLLAERKDPPRLGELLVERNVLPSNVIREIIQEQKIGRGEKRVLSIDFHERGGVAIIRLAGRLDESKQEAVTRVFERLMNAGLSKFVLDLQELLYLDSHGVSALIAYIDEARARGGDVKFLGLQPDVKFTLDRLGLTRFVQMFDQESQAVRAFGLPIDEYMSRGTLGEYVAAIRHRTFHLSYCAFLQGVHEDDKVYYESKKHARDAGKVACRRCKP